MNDQLISLSDESLDQVAGGALITLNVTGTVRSVVGSLSQFGDAAFGFLGTAAKAGKQVVNAAGAAAGEIVGSIVTIK